MLSISDLDQNRKRNYFVFVTSVFIVIFICLTVMNYLDGMMLDTVVDLIILTVCILSLVAMKYLRSDMMIYRTTFVLVSLTFFFSVHQGVGKETILYYIFAMPTFFFFYFGKKEGLIWNLLFIACNAFIMLTPSLFKGYAYDSFNISRFMITISIVLIASYGIESARFTFGRRLDLQNKVLLQEKQQLEHALREINTLSGLIPICSHCKKVRNDKGYWEQVETYVCKRSAADFSHSICPDCLEDFYPEYAEANGQEEPT